MALRTYAGAPATFNSQESRLAGKSP